MLHSAGVLEGQNSLKSHVLSLCWQLRRQPQASTFASCLSRTCTLHSTMNFSIGSSTSLIHAQRSEWASLWPHAGSRRDETKHIPQGQAGWRANTVLASLSKCLCFHLLFIWHFGSLGFVVHMNDSSFPLSQDPLHYKAGGGKGASMRFKVPLSPFMPAFDNIWTTISSLSLFF